MDDELGVYLRQLETRVMERLDRLAERHEGLTQTVELLTSDVRALTAETREREKRSGQTLDQIIEGMARLLHMAEIHEQRLEPLEGGEQ